MRLCRGYVVVSAAPGVLSVWTNVLSRRTQHLRPHPQTLPSTLRRPHPSDPPRHRRPQIPADLLAPTPRLRTGTPTSKAFGKKAHERESQPHGSGRRAE